MDQKQVCIEYWKSRPLMQIPPDCKPNNLTNSAVKMEVSNDEQIGNNSQSLPAGVDKVIDGLFKKANPEELNVLYSILNNNNNNNNPSGDQGVLIRLLNEEIHRRRH